MTKQEALQKIKELEEFIKEDSSSLKRIIEQCGKFNDSYDKLVNIEYNDNEIILNLPIANTWWLLDIFQWVLKFRSLVKCCTVIIYEKGALDRKGNLPFIRITDIVLK